MSDDHAMLGSRVGLTRRDAHSLQHLRRRTRYYRVEQTGWHEYTRIGKQRGAKRRSIRSQRREVKVVYESERVILA